MGQRYGRWPLFDAKTGLSRFALLACAALFDGEADGHDGDFDEICIAAGVLLPPGLDDERTRVAA